MDAINNAKCCNEPDGTRRNYFLRLRYETLEFQPTSQALNLTVTSANPCEKISTESE